VSYPGYGHQDPEDADEASDLGEPGYEEPYGFDDMTAEDMLEVGVAGFRRTARGVSGRFSAAEASVVRTLVGQVAELLGADDPAADPAGRPPAGQVPGAGEQAPWSADELEAMFSLGGSADPPDDPAIARLLPNGYRDDPEAAAEFRRYTEQGLRSGKVAAARTVLATLPGKGGRVHLGREDAEVWLRALNDVRLTLGVRLGITEDYEQELAANSGADPRSAYLQVYDWLSFLQESLVRALW
jgi:Domain of unknown function (DUF2017)